MYKLGLTGGIGSGKSVVAAILAQRGARVVDADAISKSVTAANGASIALIAACFGSAAIAADGALDRDWMRRLIFSDASAKVNLEKIVHPLVGQEIARQTEHAQAQGVRCLVFDIPLLIESNRWRKNLQRILIVDCTVETQMKRVERRSGLSSNEVMRIIQAQSPRQLRLQAADFVIFNEGKSLEEITDELAWLAPQFGL